MVFQFEDKQAADREREAKLRAEADELRDQVEILRSRLQALPAQVARETHRLTLAVSGGPE